MSALAKEGLLDAALEGVVGGQVDDVELAAVVNVACAHKQVIHIRGGLRTKSMLMTSENARDVVMLVP